MSVLTPELNAQMTQLTNSWSVDEVIRMMALTTATSQPYLTFSVNTADTIANPVPTPLPEWMGMMPSTSMTPTPAPELTGQELAQTVIDYLVEHPDRHHQNMFAECFVDRTVGCVVGWATLFAYGYDGSNVYSFVRNLNIDCHVTNTAKLLGIDRWPVVRVYNEKNRERSLELFAEATGAKLPTSKTEVPSYRDDA